MRRSLVVLAGVLAAVAAGAPAYASTMTFGSLPEATFNGSGIPNDAVAITTITDGSNTITLGLTATERFANPPVGNDGNGTFYAAAGGDVLDGAPSLARWNFDFYTNATGGSYTYELLYDVNPSAGTSESEFGHVNLSSVLSSQDSWNLGFNFLSASIPGIVVPPASGFNPSAAGEYGFSLIARDAAGNELGRSNILVNTVPEPGSLLLFGLGLTVAAGRLRRGFSSGGR